MKIFRCLSLALLVVGASHQQSHAIACPSGGAKVKIVINNPTAITGQQITISGTPVTGESTCGGQASSYSQVVTLTQTGDNTFIIPSSGGLNSGMWVHKITTSPPAGQSQEQHQQSVVLHTTDPNLYAKVNWTYFPNIIIVNQPGDNSCSGCACAVACTFREALNKFKQSPVSTPTLMRFTQSPGTMTQTLDLQAGSASTGPLTIDATDANGNPWIVGDGLAQAQGNQDTFSRVVDFANITKLNVVGNNVTIKGLKIANTVPGGQNPAKVLISGSATGTRIEAVQLDGGAAGTYSDSAVKHLIHLSNNAGGQVVNVEARAAFGDGVRMEGLTAATQHEVRDSWIHHNYADNVTGDRIKVTRNLIELGGRRLSNDVVVNTAGVGIKGSVAREIDTLRNVVRNHPLYGIDAAAGSAGIDLQHDYTCGNNSRGVLVSGAGASTIATGTGLTAAYNLTYGIEFDNDIAGGALTFNDHSAFTANSDCGLLNSSSVAVSALNNQWRGVDPTPLNPDPECTLPDRCTGGTVNCRPVQDYIDVNIDLDELEPVFPRNVVLKGQTVRVQGIGFNAIDANPIHTDVSCTLGNSTSSSNCCRLKSKANVCDSGSPPGAPSNKSACVALLDGTTQWRPLSVTSVTPTTIVTEVSNANPVFACLGMQGELIRVSKRRSDNAPQADFKDYCVNPL